MILFKICLQIIIMRLSCFLSFWCWCACFPLQDFTFFGWKKQKLFIKHFLQLTKSFPSSLSSSSILQVAFKLMLFTVSFNLSLPDLHHLSHLSTWFMNELQLEEERRRWKWKRKENLSEKKVEMWIEAYILHLKCFLLLLFIIIHLNYPLVNLLIFVFYSLLAIIFAFINSLFPSFSSTLNDITLWW